MEVCENQISTVDFKHFRNSCLDIVFRVRTDAGILFSLWLGGVACKSDPFDKSSGQAREAPCRPYAPMLKRKKIQAVGRPGNRRRIVNWCQIGGFGMNSQSEKIRRGTPKKLTSHSKSSALMGPSRNVGFPNFAACIKIGGHGARPDIATHGDK